MAWDLTLQGSLGGSPRACPHLYLHLGSGHCPSPHSGVWTSPQSEFIFDSLCSPGLTARKSSVGSGWGCWLRELDSLTASGEAVRPGCQPGAFGPEKAGCAPPTPMLAQPLRLTVSFGVSLFQASSHIALKTRLEQKCCEEGADHKKTMFPCRVALPWERHHGFRLMKDTAG